MNELALFAGAGGGILGGKLLGWTTICAVEINPYRISVLLQRQNDGILPLFPIWDDICTFDGRMWKGIVDVISGGFPCQDISCAGTHDGLRGKRSGLWTEMSRIISEVRPEYAFVENSPNLIIHGIDRIAGDLAEMGYDCRYAIISGKYIGAPIERERIFIAGTNKKHGEKRMEFGVEGQIFDYGRIKCPDFWLQAPSVDFGMEHGMDSYVDQVEAIGDGQIPAMAAFAWQLLICDTVGGR